MRLWTPVRFRSTLAFRADGPSPSRRATAPATAPHATPHHRIDFVHDRAAIVVMRRNLLESIS
jgi:hypothetical protein